ncbi:hypothetical protein PV10_00799 [Exophiala mesophila]|uniref:MYND-type domain-containing protein n=1 Tax=Exophiala mesophila TaxID=212818 RepID=A0A0D1ZSX7_EXOME|nr:uncharacterized protein PV10_00799 [Exophiala mesophila]KIV96989.1 hypothetical protein PV10_00799 [Exophiala mesophila]
MSMSHTALLSAPDPSGPDLKSDRGQLRHRCGLCSKTGVKLLRCSACHAVRYCSRDHQSEHRSQHKSSCRNIKRLRADLDKRDQAIRNPTAGSPIQTNAFETHVGRFTEFDHTDDYMSVRMSLLDALRRQATLDGVSEALEHLQDMLRLDRSDEFWLRDLAPPLMLQLDKDQECYDFLKWWLMVNPKDDEGAHDWVKDPPFLNIKDASVLEDVKYISAESVDVHHLAAVVLLKMKLLVDLVNIRLTRRVLKGRLPTEVLGIIAYHAVRSPISCKWVNKNECDLIDIQQTLQMQIKILAMITMRCNRAFPHLIFEVNRHVSTPLDDNHPLLFFEEMVSLVQHSYPAWWQHDGVLELLQSARQTASKVLDDEIESMTLSRSPYLKTNQGTRRKDEYLLFLASCHRLWYYLDAVVEDVVSLNTEEEAVSSKKFYSSDAEREKLRVWLNRSGSLSSVSQSDDSNINSNSV